MTCNLRINFFSVKIYEFKFQRLSESIGIAFTLDLKDLKTLRKTCTELENVELKKVLSDMISTIGKSAEVTSFARQPLVLFLFDLYINEYPRQ